jgi:hypothetical protein
MPCSGRSILLWRVGGLVYARQGSNSRVSTGTECRIRLLKLRETSRRRGVRHWTGLPHRAGSVWYPRLMDDMTIIGGRCVVARSRVVGRNRSHGLRLRYLRFERFVAKPSVASRYGCKKGICTHTLSYDDIRSDFFYGDLGFLFATNPNEQLPRVPCAIPV